MDRSPISKVELAARLLWRYRRRNEAGEDDLFEAWLGNHWDRPLSAKSAVMTRAALTRVGLYDCDVATLAAMFESSPNSQLVARRGYLFARFPAASDLPRDLTAAFFVGHLHALNNREMYTRLQEMEHAGTTGSAGALRTTGKAFGQLFGLLDHNDAPTPFYTEFFDPS